MPTMYDNMSPEKLAQMAKLYGINVTPPPAVAGPQGAQAPQPDASPQARAAAEKRLLGFSTADEAGQALAHSSNDFAIRNETTPTGGALAIPGFAQVFKALGLRNTNDLSQMQADQTKAATAATHALSPRPSTFEFQKNLEATANIGQPLAANLPIQHMNNNNRVFNQAQNTFYQTYHQKYGTLAGADQLWDKFAGQHFDAQGNYLGAPAPAAPAARPAPGAAIPSGSAIDLFGRPVGGGGGD